MVRHALHLLWFNVKSPSQAACNKSQDDLYDIWTRLSCLHAACPHTGGGLECSGAAPSESPAEHMTLVSCTPGKLAHAQASADVGVSIVKRDPIALV